MNIQEDEKKPVYKIHESVTITKQHFDWLNHEVLRIGHLARQYSDQGDLLRAELKLLRYEKIHDLGQLGETQAEVTFLKSKADYLKAEVERLRKAGDDLCSTMEANGIHDNGDFEMHEKAIAQWNVVIEQITRSK